jgi:hypothetical protein
MGFFFMGHIHLYGAGASLIGSLGAAIAWCEGASPAPVSRYRVRDPRHRARDIRH